MFHVYVSSSFKLVIVIRNTQFSDVLSVSAVNEGRGRVIYVVHFIKS